jgi:hypothetical protein
MFRVPAIALSFGLVLLWVAGVSHKEAAWLTWLDLLAGVVAFGSATPLAESRRAGIIGWCSLAFGLFILWLAAMAKGNRSWLGSWTFVAACAFLMLAGARWRKAELRTGDSL